MVSLHIFFAMSFLHVLNDMFAVVHIFNIELEDGILLYNFIVHSTVAAAEMSNSDAFLFLVVVVDVIEDKEEGVAIGLK